MMLYRFYNQDSTWLDGADFAPPSGCLCCVFLTNERAFVKRTPDGAVFDGCTVFLYPKRYLT